MGRWTARDPILYQGGQANLYVYSNNDPVNFRDPSGLICIGGSVFAGLGGGVKACFDGGSSFSLCGEFGVGLGSGVEVDLFGGVASAADAYYTKVEAGGSCGPIIGGVSAKLNSCGNLKINCPIGIKPFGDAGKILKGLAHDPCSGKWFKKGSVDWYAGELTKNLPGKKEVTVKGKIKCKVGGKAVGGACANLSF